MRKTSENRRELRATQHTRHTFFRKGKNPDDAPVGVTVNSSKLGAGDNTARRSSVDGVHHKINHRSNTTVLAKPLLSK